MVLRSFRSSKPGRLWYGKRELLGCRRYRGITVAVVVFLMTSISFGQEPVPMSGHDRKAAELPIRAGIGRVNPSAHEVEKPGVVRTYFIAADEVDWDYTPRGRNLA